VGKSGKLDIYDLNGGGYVEFSVPLLPPSTNLIYKKSRSGQIYKTGDAKEFQRRFLQALSSKMRGVYEFKTIPYELTLVIYFSNVYTKGKKILKMDASNHVKVVEDSIQEFFGYDDKCNFRVIVEKKMCPHYPRIECKLRVYRKNEVKSIFCNCSKCKESIKQNKKKAKVK